MWKRLSIMLLAVGALSAQASTITFSPNSQTVSVGGTATVDVQVSGLSRGQALGAFDLLVLNDASVIKPTSVTFLNSLGDPMSELTSSVLTGGSANAAEVSFEDTNTLLSLQSGQPFSLFELTYTALAAGTSSLSLGFTPDILSDGSGAILPAPTVVNGSITVIGGTPPPPPTVTPEPSSLVLLVSGAGALVSVARRRRMVA